MYLLYERDWAGLPHALAATLLAAAAAALLLVSFGGGDAPLEPVERAVSAGAGAPPPIAVRREPAGEPFVAAGAAFEVLAAPGAAWAAGASRAGAGPGRQAIVVAVEIENLGRRGFDPGALPYLLRGAGGELQAPWRSGVVGPDALATRAGLPVGGRAEQRLVFRVPAELRRPVLAIQPSPARALEVRVPLGAQ